MEVFSFADKAKLVVSIDAVLIEHLMKGATGERRSRSLVIVELNLAGAGRVDHCQAQAAVIQQDIAKIFQVALQHGAIDVLA